MSSSIITGAAGFIGSHLSEQLLELGENVVGIDNFDSWYDPKVKESNISSAMEHDSFSIFNENILSMDLSEILEPGMLFITLLHVPVFKMLGVVVLLQVSKITYSQHKRYLKLH